MSALINGDLVQTFVSRLADRASEHHEEVLPLDHFRVSEPVVALQEHVELPFSQSFSLQLESLEARVLEVSLGAVALTLSENAEEKLHLSCVRCKLPGDLQDDVVFKLFAKDKVLGRPIEDALLLNTLDAHDIEPSFKFADLKVGPDGLDRVIVMDRAPCGE